MIVSLNEMALAKPKLLNSFFNPEWVINVLKDHISCYGNNHLTLCSVFINQYNNSDDVKYIKDIVHFATKKCDNNFVWSKMFGAYDVKCDDQQISIVKNLCNGVIRKISLFINELNKTISNKSYKDLIYESVLEDTGVNIRDSFNISIDNIMSILSGYPIWFNDDGMIEYCYLNIRLFSTPDSSIYGGYDYDGYENNIPYFYLIDGYKLGCVNRYNNYLIIVKDVNTIKERYSGRY